MEQTKGQIRALDILTRSEAGEPRANIAASYGVSESSIYFETRFGKFLRYREQHPDDRAAFGAWGAFDKLWGRTDKKAPEATRFAELICALPLATDVQTKADKRSAKIAAVESAKPPRKARKAKTPAPTQGCDWPLATEAEAIIADKASSPLLQALEPKRDVAATVASNAVALLVEIRDNGGLAPEPIAAPAPEINEAVDPIAAKRERKTIAQRLRRAAAKAKVQWRGDPELTAAAGAE